MRTPSRASREGHFCMQNLCKQGLPVHVSPKTAVRNHCPCRHGSRDKRRLRNGPCFRTLCWAATPSLVTATRSSLPIFRDLAPPFRRPSCRPPRLTPQSADYGAAPDPSPSQPQHALGDTYDLAHPPCESGQCAPHHRTIGTIATIS